MQAFQEVPARVATQNKALLHLYLLLEYQAIQLQDMTSMGSYLHVWMGFNLLMLNVSELLRTADAIINILLANNVIQDLIYHSMENVLLGQHLHVYHSQVEFVLKQPQDIL